MAGCAITRKYPLASSVRTSEREKGLDSAATTAMGRPLGSMLIAKPKSTSCITGTPIIIAKVRRSRRTCTNSFMAMAAKRLHANTA